MRTLVLVLVLGCGGGGSSAPPPETAQPVAAADARGACEAAISKAAVTGRGGREADAFEGKVAAAMADGCVATTWSPEMLLCLSNSPTEAELKSCESLLTPAQQADMNQRFDAVLREENAASGSAAGSAAPQ